MELKLPGSKIKNVLSNAKALLPVSQPTAREVSKLLGKLSHATIAMRAALSLYHLSLSLSLSLSLFQACSTCLLAAVHPLQDYTEPCSLTGEAKEELTWWVIMSQWLKMESSSFEATRISGLRQTPPGSAGEPVAAIFILHGGSWSTKKATMHTNWLKLLVANLAIHTFISKTQQNMHTDLSEDGQHIWWLVKQSHQISTSFKGQGLGTLVLVLFQDYNPVEPLTFSGILYEKADENFEEVINNPQFWKGVLQWGVAMSDILNTPLQHTLPKLWVLGNTIMAHVKFSLTFT